MNHPTGFEYRVVPIERCTAAEIETRINELAQLGWTVTCVIKNHVSHMLLLARYKYEVLSNTVSEQGVFETVAVFPNAVTYTATYTPTPEDMANLLRKIDEEQEPQKEEEPPEERPEDQE